MLAVIVEDFRARAARADIAHLPEIVRGRDAEDLVFGEARDLLPQLERLVVLGEHGDEEPLARQAEFLGDQVPGELDGELLEVVAEGEVAEHLEKRVVTRGVADIVQVVVLAAGAHAFLRGRGARIGTLLQPGEDVLELHHAGIGEHQRRVVARHERRGRQDLVAVPAEVVEKARSDLVDAAHFVTVTRFLENANRVNRAAQLSDRLDLSRYAALTGTQGGRQRPPAAVAGCF